MVAASLLQSGVEAALAAQVLEAPTTPVLIVFVSSPPIEVETDLDPPGDVGQVPPIGPEFAQEQTEFAAARTAEISEARQDVAMQGVTSDVSSATLLVVHWQALIWVSI